MWFKVLLFIFLASPAWAGLPPTRILDEGTDKGVAFKFDCVGAGIVCSQSGITGTLTVGAGGGGDSVSIDGVAVTDPNFNSTGDVDFVDTANVVTGTVVSVRPAAETSIEAIVDLQDLQGAVTDGQVPNTITIDLATLATTATTANAGDSATSFFSSGTLEEGLLPDSATVTGWALGASTATTLNKLTLTQPATGSTLTIVDGKTLTVTNTVDLAATVTDEQVCNYEGTGTQINCDIAIDATTDCAAGAICGGGHTHAGGTGDIESVGDVASGAAFDGTQGTTLTFNNAGGDATISYDGTNITLSKPLVNTSASLTTPSIGVATATSINKVAITAPATSATLTIADGKTLTVNNTATIGTLTDTKFCTYTAAGTVINCTSDGGSGAPTDADYLVGTANGSLSAEIVVGTTPGGELGGTWGTPTIDDSVTVTGWVMGASTATTPAADDNDTSLATTAFVQSEFGNYYWTLLPQGAVLDDAVPPAISVVESTGTGTSRRYVADFDAATDEVVYWSFVLPADYSAGNITATVLWYANDVGPTETVFWETQLSCTTEADADSMTEDAGATVNTASEDVNETEANRLISTDVTISNLDSAAAGDFCTLRFARDANNASDDLTSDARLLSVRLTIPRI